MFSRPSVTENLRRQSAILRDLPDDIELPAISDRNVSTTKSLDGATLDDVAFAIKGLQARMSQIEAPLYALKRLYDLARDEGALGATRIADLPPLRSGTGR